jgi:hypothetical protein
LGDGQNNYISDKYLREIYTVEKLSCQGIATYIKKDPIHIATADLTQHGELVLAFPAVGGFVLDSRKPINFTELLEKNKPLKLVRSTKQKKILAF